MNDMQKPLDFGELSRAAVSLSETTAPDTLPIAELEPATAENVFSSSKAVAIIGGGLAGMAAAAVAIQQGLQVDLFEQSSRLGGRASSFQESWNGQTIDQCRHVALGCCTSFMDFCRRVGVDDCFQRHKTLHFIGPDGAQSDFAAVGWLPPPLHLLPGLLRLKYLTWRECWSLVHTLRKLFRIKFLFTRKNQETLDSWLRRQGQSAAIIEKFWSVVLLGALSETVDHASLAAAKKVFADGFFSSRHAYELITPRLPLVEIFDRRAAQWLEQQGVRIHRGARVVDIQCPDADNAAVTLDDGLKQFFRAAIVAVRWFETPSLLSSLDVALKLQDIQQIPAAAITAVHLWFDRAITTLPHAALVGRLSQWIFNESVLMSKHARDETVHEIKDEKSYYYQVVISAAHRVVKQETIELLQTVLSDLQAVFPHARQAKLLHWRVVTMPRAVLSLQPGVDRLRPSQQTAVPNLFFAGDWTATGWPGTMEGAVWSGYLAVEALLQFFGHPGKRSL